MTRCILTQGLIDELKPKEKRYDMTDIDHPGFGCRVLPSGRLNWFMRYRVKDSVRMVILGQTSWMRLGPALSKFKMFKNLRAQGEEPRGVNPTAEEADYMYYELFKIYDRGLSVPQQIQGEPEIEAFADFFKVHPAAVRKLAAYGQVKLIKNGDSVRVMAYPVTIKTSFVNGLQIR